MNTPQTIAICLVAAIGAAAAPTNASAQITRLGDTIALWSDGGARGSDIAFDYKNNVYLAVSSFGTVRGRYISADGIPLGTAFIIQASPYLTHFPRVAYSPDAAGGAGGFLVTWHASVGSGGTDVYSRVVSYTAGLGTESWLMPADSFWEAGAAVAYATGSQEFLVVWQSYLSDINAVRVANSGVPIGTPFNLTPTADGERDPNVAYNPATDEFLVVYSGWNASYAFVRAQRVKAGTGVIIGSPTHLTASSGTYITNVAYNSATGKFLAAWYQIGGHHGRLVNPDGSVQGDVVLLATTYAAYDALGLAYNSTSGTFHTISQGPTAEDGGVEIGGDGLPLNSGTQITSTGGNLGNFYPRLAAHTARPEWTMTAAHEFAVTIAQRFATATGPPTPPVVTQHPSSQVARNGSPVSFVAAASGSPAPTVQWQFSLDGSTWNNVNGATSATYSFSASFAANGKLYRAVFTNSQGSVMTGSASLVVLTPPVADFDGNGKSDPSVYRPTGGYWFVKDQFTVQWGVLGDIPVPGDYNGDGRTDVAVWRPSTGEWWVRSLFVVQWGLPGDVPVPGDYNGDGRTDVAIWRPSTGEWYVRDVLWAQWGLPGDLPVPGDYNGDGRTDIAIWRPSTGDWYIRDQGKVTWGSAADLPVPGDYDGDGRTDVAIYRPSTGEWHVRNQFVIGWGGPGDVPMPADVNGDGVTDLGVWRPLTGEWHVRNHFVAQWGMPGDMPLGSLPPWRTRIAGDLDGDRFAELARFRPAQADWDILWSSTGFTARSNPIWGVTGDVPVGGDYDGDGKRDLTVYRPSAGIWFILKSSTNFAAAVAYQWGMNGDVPAPADFDGDGKTDLAVFRPSAGTWHVLKSTSNFVVGATYPWGVAGDVPVPGDYDGDGKADPAIFQPSSGAWFILKSSANFNVGVAFVWGVNGDITAPADYDGDGRTDAAVFRPSTGTWHILKSTTGFVSGVAYDWGLNGDVVLPGDYDGDGKADPTVFRPSTGTWHVLKSTTQFVSGAIYQ